MQAYAAVAVAPWKVEYQPVQTPEPGPDDVVVRVTHSWISNGTEGSFIRGERIAGDTPRSETDPMPFPHISGYQKVGIVEWVGAAASGIEAGESVFCTMGSVEGMFYPFAGHVSPCVAHKSQIWKLPAGLEPWHASGLVLTQVGYNTGARVGVSPGDAALVIGDGMVGHWTAQTLRHRGARVMMVGRHDERLALWDKADGDALVNERTADVVAEARAWAPEGLQAVADTVGDIALLESLFPAMRHNGHISSAGFYGHNGKVDIQKMRNWELTLHSPSGWAQDRMDATLDLLARGILRTDHLVTHRFPAEQAGAAFDLVLNRTEPVLGVILDW
ncbi:MAG: zinc-binding dehydrogenase [Armatimonadetes bacterium]|nr:zinc-binding dehydrogenase [Armatimonadota bacterium]